MKTERNRFHSETLFLFILLAGACGITFGQFSPAGDPEGVAEKLNQQAGTIRTLQSDFIQKKQLTFLDETIISRGRFWFRKTNSLRWAYEEPFEYAIIINEGKFQIKDGERVSAYDIESNEVFRAINDLIINLVQGKIMDREQFEIKVLQSEKQYLVKLTSRESRMQEVIPEMEVYFDRKDLTVSRIIMKESETDYTEITFTDKRINETIPETVFTTAY